MQGTADLHQALEETRLAEAARVVAMSQRLIGSSPQTPSVRSQLRSWIYCTRRSDWSFFFVDTRVPEREKTLGSVMSALCSKRAIVSRGVGMQ